MIKEFFEKYFINPILKGDGYNIINTITYGVILAIVSLLLFKLLKKIKIRFDLAFFFSLMPFIILGSTLRVLRDLNLVTSFLFVTPFIYIIIFLITIFTLLISLIISKFTKMEYQIVLFSLGLLYLLAIFSRLYVHIVDYTPLFLVIKFTIISSILFFILIIMKRMSKENGIVIISHCFDVSTTFVAVNSSKFIEQHVVANLLISTFGSFSLFFAKIISIMLALYIIDKKIKKKEERSFVKFVIIILGLAPGLRNLFLMMCLGI